MKTKIKAKDMAMKSKEELGTDLGVFRERMLELRMKRGDSRNKNVKEVRELRKNVARILTHLRKV